MTRNHLQLLHSTILTDDGVKLDGAAVAGLARQRRLNRLNAIDEVSGLNVAADGDALGGDLRRRRSGG